MLLKKLINNLTSSSKSIDVRDLALDSRKVKKGSLFFALKGKKLDGEKFIKDAEKKGASAIICSSKIKSKNYNIPIIRVKNIRETLAKSCEKFYKKKPKNIIAVTGTNGKSSVADFFYQILLLNKIPVASIGTLGIKKNRRIKEINLTSPDIISLHKELSQIKKDKIDNVIIEASSHGLHQGRLDGLDFKVGIFTNFSQDHLDYHKSMKKYLDSKMILFSKLIKKNRYMITDNSIKEFSKLKKIAIKKKLKLFTIKNDSIIKNRNFSQLIGSFQKKNLFMSILAAKLCGLKMKKIIPKLKDIKSVNGRLQLVRTFSNKTKIFIDYAHTPDALLTALKSLKETYNNNVTLVFGCGGERDVKKRVLMAKIAKNFCNKIYVTDDNPRKENPKKIRKSIIKNLKKTNYIEIGDRAKAIQTAVKNSESLELILVAGKGHEAYQDYGNKIIKISDKNIINKIKFKKSKFNRKQFNYFFNSKVLNKVLNKKNQYKFQGVSINSKEIKKGNLFIAIKGKNKDGHNYVSEALKNGANYCVVSKKIRNIDKKKLINFNSTNNFLNKIALTKRKMLQAKIIAVTGSSGKTTLKTFLGKLLNVFSKTYFSPKSYNNRYGVPLSLSNLEREHCYGVFEVGMSKAGEINSLSKLIKPDVAIITNIAEAHIENFKNIKGIAKAKSEIINNIKKNGKLILNRDDKFFNYFSNLAKKKKIKTISFGISSKSDVYPISIKKLKNEKNLTIQVMGEKLSIKSRNINLYNILSSLAVLKILNLDLKKILKSFQSLQSLDGRGKMHYINRYKTNFKLIDESYNANPLSVKNAIINLSNIKKNNSKKYLLLGDMLELGKNSDFYHKNLSKVINNTDIDKIFVYGDKILKTYKHTLRNKRGNILQNKNDFDDVFSNLIKKDDYLMIKGSNATGLCKLTKEIIKGTSNVI